MEKRNAVRAVLLTPEGRILLMKIEEPVSRKQFWITPGGALEGEEDAEAGLQREVAEETGLQDVQMGPLMWTREHEFTWKGRHIRQKEAYYLVETSLFEPSMEDNPAEGELSAFRGFRWWSVAEIRASSDVFVPRKLADLVEELVRRGPPEEPFEVEI